MALRLGDTAPDFTAETTDGPINFHEWIGDSWAVLFSHPKDFTPVCTTELGCMAGLEPEFKKRNTKIIGLSVDPVDDHKRWMKDIEETQGHEVTYPLIGDRDLKVATPVNWKQGEDVIIVPSVSDDEAKQKYPQGWKSPKPYIRIVPQPKG